MYGDPSVFDINAVSQIIMSNFIGMAFRLTCRLFVKFDLLFMFLR